MERFYCPECNYGMVTYGPTFDPDGGPHSGVWVHVCPLGHTLRLTGNDRTDFVCGIELGNYYAEQRNRHKTQTQQREASGDA